MAYDSSIQSQTWIAHTLASIAAAFFMGGLFAFFNKEVLIGAVAGGWASCFLFMVKEEHDRAVHRAKGDYDTPDASGVAPRADRIGDLLGPFAFTLGLTFGAFISWLW